MTSTPILTPSHQQIYDTDFVEWIDQAVELLKQGRFDQLDIENLLEEVEDLGRRQKQALKSNLCVLLTHILKWQYQANQRSSSWRGSINEHRYRIQLALEDSPSLKNYYLDTVNQCYAKARQYAADETRLDISAFPVQCPYTPEQVLEDGFPSAAE